MTKKFHNIAVLWFGCWGDLRKFVFLQPLKRYPTKFRLNMHFCLQGFQEIARLRGKTFIFMPSADSERSSLVSLETKISI